MTEPLTVLIIDDEPIARRRLGRLLRPIPHVQVLGEAGDVASAVAETRRLAPDLLLLDIRIPGGDGFDVIDRLGRDVPLVIFVTAFDHHAIRAFDLEAVDYVTKPVEAPRLARAIDRARAAAAASGQTERITELLATVDTLRRSLRAEEPADAVLWVRDGSRHCRLSLADISHIEAEGDYVRVHGAGRSHLVSDSLSAMETRLAPSGFVRIHRGTLVRRDAIVTVERLGYGALAINLSNGARLRVGRTYATALRGLIGEG